MPQKTLRTGLLLFALCAVAAMPRLADAASCTTQAQMTAVQRDALAAASRSLAAQVQNGDVQSIKANTLPVVAADFSGIERSVKYIKPLIQTASVTVDELYLLDASTDSPGAAQTDFFCGSPVVGFDFHGLPPGTYALAIVHATGVQQPQQLAMVLAKSSDNRWLLAGFFDKPMVMAGHDGVWYWAAARKYAQNKADWAASFYYRIATYLLDPVDFLASSNLEKLRHEGDAIHPELPAVAAPLTVNANGATFKVTSIDTTTVFGPLDLEVHYIPDQAQVAELHYPVIARKQVSDLMAALLTLHPELHSAFHGMWLHADQGNASVFALELPMNPGSPATASDAEPGSPVH